MTQSIIIIISSLQHNNNNNSQLPTTRQSHFYFSPQFLWWLQIWSEWMILIHIQFCLIECWLLVHETSPDQWNITRLSLWNNIWNVECELECDHDKSYLRPQSNIHMPHPPTRHIPPEQWWLITGFSAYLKFIIIYL